MADRGQNRMGAKSTRTRYAYAYWGQNQPGQGMLMLIGGKIKSGQGGGQGAKSCPETPVLSGAFYPVPLFTSANIFTNHPS